MKIITANLSKGYLTNEIDKNDKRYYFYYSADNCYVNVIKKMTMR